MKYLTLEQIKENCRIDHDYEDNLLINIGDSAENAVKNYTKRSYDEFLSEYGEVPADVVRATLMLVDLWYNYRSMAGVQPMAFVPYTFEFTLKPYIKL